MTDTAKCPPVGTYKVEVYVRGEWKAATIVGRICGTDKQLDRGVLVDEHTGKLWARGWWRFPGTNPTGGDFHHATGRNGRKRWSRRYLSEKRKALEARSVKLVGGRAASRKPNPKFNIKKLLTTRFRSCEYDLAEKIVEEGYSEVIEHRGYWYVQKI